ncbi:MAG: MBL fold metallo-hydrolase [Betaproteobacteria bacterium]|nr:MBL fold metallo-hydrolase [Betaproteobacteria bacterium]
MTTIERGPASAAGAVAISFLGAAGEVTGSCFRVDCGQGRFLVDCGMFQGGRDADEKNASALDFDAATLDFVVLTHAHIDHSGLLPRLTARGFRGPIYATPATADLAGVMLPDSAHIQEKESEWAREREHDRRSAPRRAQGERRAGHRAPPEPPADAVPLYTLADAERCLRQFRPLAYDVETDPRPGIALRFRDAGHILGSAIAEIRIGDGGARRKLVFSGDIGQPGRPVLGDPTPVPDADVLVVESTYGDRLHKDLATTYDEFAGVLARTLPRGNVVIPAFAVGRTQEVLYVLADLVRLGRAPALTIFVDSPLATRATEITARYASILDRESRDLAAWQARHRDRVRVVFTESPQDSMAINEIRSGAVIVAASGMCDAGRVKHHLRLNLPRPECAIVFTGFQAGGTLGRQIVDGAAHVRLFRQDVAVRASVHTIGGLSAHGDQAALLGWLAGFRRPPARVFVVHGERDTALGFGALIRERLHWPSVEIPARGDRIPLA